jgi:hypothetical protein
VADYDQTRKLAKMAFKRNVICVIFDKHLVEACVSSAFQRVSFSASSAKQLVISRCKSQNLLWCIICFGILLRITQYLSNRSLWVDEAMLALNIIHRSLPELLSPLDYNQGAPIGFLIAQKLFVEIFGTSEYALRLLPLLCGIISLFLFVRVAKEFVEPKSLIVATGLFAISYKLIFYSSEVKQYSSDVAVALVLYSVTLYIQNAGLSAARSLVFGMIGAFGIWFSHPATFVVAGIGGTLSGSLAHNKQWSKLLLLMNAGLLWAVSFGALYLISLHSLSQNSELLNYWSYGFMPFPPKSVADLRWFDKTFFEIFKEPLGLLPASIAAVTFLIGGLSMAIEKKDKFFLLAAPIMFALLASGLQSYPFTGRLLLFAAPFIIVCIAEGVMRVGLLVRNKQNLLNAAVASVLLVPQLLYSSTILVKPYFFEDVKPAMEYISKRWQKGDILYVYHGAQPTFQFYSAKYGFSEKEYVRGEANRENLLVFENELHAFQSHKRFWVLFAHIDRSNGIDDVNLFLEHIGRNRTLTDAFKGTDAAAYLYSKPDP